MLALGALAVHSLLATTISAEPDFKLQWRGKLVVSAEAGYFSGKPTWHEVKRDATPVPLGYSHGPADAQFVPAGRQAETYTITFNVRPGFPFAAVVDVSDDAWPCNDQKEAPLGSTIGHPDSLLNNAIYDRTSDWLVSTPNADMVVERIGARRYRISGPGPAQIQFRHDYYRDHLGYFLWDRSKPLWKKPVAGWCSWMAYLQDVNEKNMLDASAFFSKNLKDYGYNVIQMDDGYQRVPQDLDSTVLTEPFANFWTKPNAKFPSGLESLAHRIKADGMTPGIWMGYYLPKGLHHQEGYVTDPNGQPHKGPWVNYAMNGLDKPAREEGYLEAIREFKRQGWDYFKVDTLRHVLYDSYRKIPEYWMSRHESMEEAYRTILSETKKAVGPNTYLMACWGTIPELAGLPDGARIGEDVGPAFGSMEQAAKHIAQFQYLNNVVWRNDPDYMCLRVPVDQARTWASLTFLAGGHIMVSDPIEAYDPDRVDILRRVGPPLVSRPASLVSHGPDPELFTLNCEKDGEQWLIVGRFAWKDLPARPIPLKELGLDPAKAYLGFDFWSEQAVGVKREGFKALTQGNCQVICLRRVVGHPQLLGTNRHLGQGVHELSKVRWNKETLSGTMQRGEGRRWSLFAHVPDGWIPTRVSPEDATQERSGQTLKLTFAEGKEPVDWSISFRVDPPRG